MSGPKVKCFTSFRSNKPCLANAPLRWAGWDLAAVIGYVISCHAPAQRRQMPQTYATFQINHVIIFTKWLFARLPHIKCIRLGSVRSSHLPFKMCVQVSMYLRRRANSHDLIRLGATVSRRFSSALRRRVEYKRYNATFEIESEGLTGCSRWHSIALHPSFHQTPRQAMNIRYTTVIPLLPPKPSLFHLHQKAPSASFSALFFTSPFHWLRRLERHLFTVCFNTSLLVNNECCEVGAFFWLAPEYLGNEISYDVLNENIAIKTSCEIVYRILT